jgi:hypothetical protein
LGEQDDADLRELAIHRRVSRLKYSNRCAEASAVQAHMKQGLPLAPRMEIGYVVRDAHKWEVDPERTASEFDAVHYRGLLEKALGREKLPVIYSMLEKASSSGLGSPTTRTSVINRYMRTRAAQTLYAIA